MIKTLVYHFEPASPKAKAEAGYVIICVRGDHDVNENKAKRLCRAGL
jgi:prolyl-tRNA editing enzyme YbaK/EbsC (Cys-tRNA(Pro) deacylase)